MSTYNASRVIKCPYCNLESSELVQTSGNTFGGVTWSDGYFLAPCCPREYPLRRCRNCKRYFHLKEAVSVICRRRSRFLETEPCLTDSELDDSNQSAEADTPDVDWENTQEFKDLLNDIAAWDKAIDDPDSDIWKKPLPPDVLKLEDIYPEDDFPNSSQNKYSLLGFEFLGFEDVVKAIRQYDLLKVAVSRPQMLDLRIMLVEQYNNRFRELRYPWFERQNTTFDAKTSRRIFLDTVSTLLEEDLPEISKCTFWNLGARRPKEEDTPICSTLQIELLRYLGRFKKAAELLDTVPRCSRRKFMKELIDTKDKRVRVFPDCASNLRRLLRRRHPHGNRR